jgi:hypothetical protein
MLNANYIKFNINNKVPKQDKNIHAQTCDVSLNGPSSTTTGSTWAAITTIPEMDFDMMLAADMAVRFATSKPRIADDNSTDFTTTTTSTSEIPAPGQKGAAQ